MLHAQTEQHFARRKTEGFAERMARGIVVRRPIKRLQFFEKDAIEWKDECDLHSFYQTLLNLRRENAALNGDTAIAPVHRLSSSRNDKILAYLRKNESKEVLVVLNLSTEGLDVEINDQIVHGKFIDVFSSEENDFTTNRKFRMEAWSYRVFEK